MRNIQSLKQKKVKTGSIVLILEIVTIIIIITIIIIDEYNITLNSRRTCRLTLRIPEDKLLTNVLTELRFKVTTMIHLNRSRLAKVSLYLDDIAI